MAPLDAFFVLRLQHGLNPDNVERIRVRLPEDAPFGIQGAPEISCPRSIAQGAAAAGFPIVLEFGTRRESSDEASEILAIPIPS
jgi:hypothetical protein